MRTGVWGAVGLDRGEHETAGEQLPHVAGVRSTEPGKKAHGARKRALGLGGGRGKQNLGRVEWGRRDLRVGEVGFVCLPLPPVQANAAAASGTVRDWEGRCLGDGHSAEAGLALGKHRAACSRVQQGSPASSFPGPQLL